MSVIDQLVALVERLYLETEDYENSPSDAQLWYNRGYANGIVAFLLARNYADKINHLNLDAVNLYRSENIMEWHKAYHHGFEVGERECSEVLN
jgi:hypothetical protein